MEMTKTISKTLGLDPAHVTKVLRLLAEGATIPFIARYRKEMTGSMDEVAITAVRDLKKQFGDLEDRKSAIVKSLTERALLTARLEKQIEAAQSLTVLEDLYEKYRPKKKTRGMMAKEKGLDGLAGFLIRQTGQDPSKEAVNYIDPEKGVHDIDQALAGARDILAEAVSENAANREAVRKLFQRHAKIRCTVKKDKEQEGVKFKDYFDWSEPAFSAPSHRVLAMLRGKNEGVLTLRILPDEDTAVGMLASKYVKSGSACAAHVHAAVKDGYKRLLSRSIETQCMTELKQKADEKAVRVFAENTRALLLSPPLGQKAVLAIDPGFRTGCKVVCLDRQGTLRHHDVIHPHTGRSAEAAEMIETLCRRFDIEAVAIGNGTADRETHAFVQGVKLNPDVQVVMVDESGASIYSASKAARDEFPDHDITVRGAVSIGRRLMDPLAELVKIDPRSIGVGQYQHDVDPKLLEATLDDVVISCVNQVGVEVNTASEALLTRVAGLNKTIAANIVAFRNENGPFRNRKTLMKVPRLGPKAFEQAAGFLRIRNADHPLDNSGIHPESYAVVEQMARDLGTGIARMLKNARLVGQIRLEKYVTDSIGLPTLRDIEKELLNPGRDPRQQFENVAFDETVRQMTDLSPGMRLHGVVTNVTAFGAFVDIGVHQDGLVHISQMADRFIKDPGEVVCVRQKVRVTVLDVDVKRKRISLSMKEQGPRKAGEK